MREIELYEEYLAEKMADHTEGLAAADEDLILRMVSMALDDPKMYSIIDDQLFDLESSDIKGLQTWLKRVT